MLQSTGNLLKFKNLGIDTQQELVVFIPRSSHIYKAEGFQALTRVTVSYLEKDIFAALNITEDHLLEDTEVSLSLSAAKKLGLKGGELIAISHFKPVESMSLVRSKIYGNNLSLDAYNSIIADIVDEKYSNIFLSAFITACSGNNMSPDEICYLTKAMIDSGNRLHWGTEVIGDKHCIGGLPGNRTTMILVPIVASLGIAIPKTSSRAITSPAGTADTMEVLTSVDLTLEQLEGVVKKENGCIAWGGAISLSPADDIIIRVERALDVDGEAQMVASILSKKVAAGATHCVLDIPVGATAKVRSMEAAQSLKEKLQYVADYVGLKISVVFSDGSQPVGNGIGPSLEARDVLAVLRNERGAPADLREKSILLAAEVVSLTKKIPLDKAHEMAAGELANGNAYKKLIAICEAQGGFCEPAMAALQKVVVANRNGVVTEIDNRRVSRLAKLAGAPESREAGLDFHIKLKQRVAKGQPLFTIHSNSTGEMEYAFDYYKTGIQQTIKIENG